MGGFLNRDSEIPTDVRQFVDSTIQSKKIVIFSKSYCPYCRRAKEALGKYPIDKSQYQVVELEDREDCSNVQSYLRQLTGASSVPRVFIDGKFVGGGDDTVRLDQNGELEKILQNCGVI